MQKRLARHSLARKHRKHRSATFRTRFPVNPFASMRYKFPWNRRQRVHTTLTLSFNLRVIRWYAHGKKIDRPRMKSYGTPIFSVGFCACLIVHSRRPSPQLRSGEVIAASSPRVIGHDNRTERTIIVICEIS